MSRPLCSQERFQGIGGKKNPLLAIERRFFGHPARILPTIAAKLSETKKVFETSVISDKESFGKRRF
jgi:hypothetical protein